MSIIVLSQATQKRIDSPKKELTTHDSLEKRLVESILQLSTPEHWHSSNLLIFSQPKETTHTVVCCHVVLSKPASYSSTMNLELPD